MIRSILLYIILVMLCAYSLLAQENKLEDLHRKLHSSKTNSLAYVNTLTNLGAYYSVRKVMDSAFYFYYKALPIAEKLDNVLILNKIYTGLGNAFQNHEEYDKALMYHQKALKRNKKLKNWEEVCKNYNNIALIYKSTKQYEQALLYYDKALAIQKTLDNRNKAFALVMLYNNKANLKVLQQKNAEAIELLKKALAICQTEKMDMYMAITQVNLAEAYLKEKSYEKAESLLWSAIEIGSSTKSLEIESQSYKILSLIRQQQQDYRKAMKLYEVYDSLDKIIYDKAKLKQIHELEAKYETAKKDKAIAEQEKKLAQYAESQSRFRFLTLLLASLLVLIIIAIYILYLRHKRQKAEKKLAIYDLEQSLTAQEELKTQLEFQQKELLSISLQKVQQQEAIAQIKDYVKETNVKQEESLKKIKQLAQSVENMDKNWEEFKVRFEQIHKEFFIIFQNAFPALTQNDLRMCAFIKLQLGKKQIATLLNVTPKAVEISRYRLKKKLNLRKEESLDKFIINLA